jgi:hypothetical protein
MRLTRRRRVLLILLMLVVLSQAPFAYRRYQLGRLNSTIQTLNSHRQPQTMSPGFVEYKGVVHVHSFLGGHSKGSFDEIIAAAVSNQLNFVVMTEHTSDKFNTAAMTLKGMHSGILFVNGNELSTSNGDRVLVLPGDELGSPPATSTTELTANVAARRGLSFAAYPEEFRSWDANFTGIEIYNVYTNARRINPALMFFDALWSYRSYSELLFARFYSRPANNLQKWDGLLDSGRRLTAIAGNDAHANIGASFNDSTGKKILGLQLDPYERSFRLVRLHVLIPLDQQLTSESLLSALAQGHCFIGFDLFGNTTSFSFVASNGTDTKIQGDEIVLKEEVRLTVKTPLASRVVLMKNGVAIHDADDVLTKEFDVTEKGTYRVEVYPSQLPKPVSEQPWIISNPIYVR